MSLAQCNMTALTQNGVDAFVRNVCNQPHQVSRLLKCIEKAPVGAVLIVESAGIANNGAQYHCGSLTSSARIFSRLDVVKIHPHYHGVRLNNTTTFRKAIMPRGAAC